MRAIITSATFVATLAMALPVEAQTCTLRGMQAGIAIAKKIERTVPSCERAANRPSNVAYACRKCGPVINAILQLDRWSKKNPGCLTGNAGQYVVRSLSHHRKIFRDFKRFCGF